MDSCYTSYDIASTLHNEKLQEQQKAKTDIGAEKTKACNKKPKRATKGAKCLNGNQALVELGEEAQKNKLNFCSKLKDQCCFSTKNF